MTTSKRICPRKKGGPPLFDALARSLKVLWFIHIIIAQLVTECLEAHPRARPSLESVKCRLYQMSHYFTLFEKSGTGVVSTLDI